MRCIIARFIKRKKEQQFFCFGDSFILGSVNEEINEK